MACRARRQLTQQETELQSLAMQADDFMYPSMDDREPQPLKTQRLHKLPFRKRLLKRDKTKFMKYVSSTTTHGVRRIFIGKSKIRRVVWALLFLSVFCGCCYTTLERILYYASAPTATTVSTVHVHSIQFPAVTLCNTNSFRKSYLDENNLTGLVQSAFQLEITNSSNYYQNQCSEYKMTRNRSFRQVAMEGGQKLEEFVIDCSFVGLPCNIKKEFVPTLTHLGVCYTFNTGKNFSLRQVKGSGYRHDLELVLNIEQHLYGATVDNDAGIRVTVHNPEHPPRPLDVGVSVPPGKAAFISLRPHMFDDRSKANYSKTPTSPSDLELLENYNYSFPASLNDCLLKDIAETCHCIDNTVRPPLSGPYSHLPLCNISQLCCIIASVTLVEECNCTKECNHTTYETSTSYSAYPARFEVKKTAEQYNTTPEIVQHSFVKVHVYFEELTIQAEVTVRSYGIGSLLSDIGGALGLFLGASIISLTEFLMWILDEIKDRCFGINERRLKGGISSVLEEDEEAINQAEYEFGQSLSTYRRADTVICCDQSTRL